jgi:hypothetical protein
MIRIAKVTSLSQKLVQILAFVVLLATLVGTASAQDPGSPSSLKQTLASLRRDAMTAWQKKDAETLKATMAPDFLFIGPQGIAARESWLASLPHCSLASYTMDQVQLVELSANSAVLIYRMHYVGDCDGHPIPPDTAVTDTFARRDGKWWIVATTFTPQM